MKLYKGFDKELKCRGFQYEVGKTYEEPKAILCETGFHACEDPLDVLNYYDITNGRFAEVDLDDVSPKRCDDDTKRVGKKIHIRAEISLKDFIKAVVDFMFEKTDAVKDANKISSERYAKLASSGDRAKLAASGYGAKLAASGDGAKLASSGDGAKLASSGDRAKLAASGYGAKLAASGDGAKLAASGDGAKLAASGDGAVVMASGVDSIAKANKGSWITLAEWDYDNGKWMPIHVVTKKVDGNRIKADTYYRIKNGKFVEVCE